VFIDEIRKLLQKKEIQKNNKEDLERIDVLKVLLKDDNIFFQLDIDTAYGILDFLGVDSDKISEVYDKLISFEEYQKNKNYKIQDDKER